jgi:hypothetical protein
MYRVLIDHARICRFLQRDSSTNLRVNADRPELAFRLMVIDATLFVDRFLVS